MKTLPKLLTSSIMAAGLLASAKNRKPDTARLRPAEASASIDRHAYPAAGGSLSESFTLSPPQPPLHVHHPIQGVDIDNIINDGIDYLLCNRPLPLTKGGKCMKPAPACLKILGLGLITATLLAPIGVAQAGAIHHANLFTDNTLAANDDGSTSLVPLGFTINFYGQTYSDLYVNNNGNVTFTGPLFTYTPFSLLSTSLSMLAPFFADVDTLGTGSGLVQYGTDTLNGRNVFGVNWIDVGYYYIHVDKLNSFQLIIIDRSDIGVGDFDFEFNYDRILWETGDASGGSDGLGGYSARVGWSNGVSASFELAGSAINGALLDGGPHALVSNSFNSNILGQYVFQVRNGQVVPPQPIPEPVSSALLGIGLVGLAAARRKGKLAA